MTVTCMTDAVILWKSSEACFWDTFGGQHKNNRCFCVWKPGVLPQTRKNHRVVIFLVGAKLAKKPLRPVRILHGFVLHRGESGRTCGVRPERARRLGILGESFEAPLSLDTWVLFKGLAGVGRRSVCCLLCFGAFLLFFGGGWDYEKDVVLMEARCLPKDASCSYRWRRRPETPGGLLGTLGSFAWCESWSSWSWVHSRNKNRGLDAFTYCSYRFIYH